MDYPNRFIESYVHNAGIGVLVELGISGSVVPYSDVLARLAKDLAMHIAAMAPISVGELLQQPSVMNPENGKRGQVYFSISPRNLQGR